MPAFDVDSQSPGGSFEPQPADNWSMPLGAIAGIRLYISYSVFIALAVLTGLVAMVQGREGNSDLPLVTLTAVTIWFFGWGVQLLVHLCLHYWTDAKSESITIGVLGVEAANPLYRRYPWTAVANLMAACFSLTALVIFGAACLAVHMLTRTDGYADATLWLRELATPGLGLDAVANCYLTAAWLFWIQAACQAYPLPKNLGRGALASVVVLLAADADDSLQLRLLRRLLQFVSLITVVIAMATLIADGDVNLPRWPILLLLAVALWVSTRKSDLHDWITSVHIAGADPISAHFDVTELRESDLDAPVTRPSGVKPKRTPWISEMIDSVRMRQKRKRVRAAMRREHEEASDAARLDQVLQIVSEHGTEGLSAEDRALLMRVSKNLQRHRQSHADGETDSR
ncbi:hypothetical protein Mal15_24450 [Stieleria maiorica]|uniref:Transmembrane protein n=1 Tax=Stieleria maiorica TaxID=2795974 RepID=A0A5B9MCA1_9BACT|nr:hypothetical protein [Stieleria maiorica]QEF98393.1 hypothetical protein Mal15_24450 [Stieleria maiorica]